MQAAAPRFPPVLRPCNVAFTEAHQADAALLPDVDSLLKQICGDGELSEVFQELRILIAASMRPMGSEEDATNIINVSYDLEHRLVVLEASQHPLPDRVVEETDASQPPCPVTAICPAVHILLYLGFREMPRGAECFKAFVATLKRELDNEILERLLTTSPDLLLWLTSIGASVTSNAEDMGWCQKCAEKVVQRLGLQTTEECEELVNRFAWLKALTETYASAFWNRVIGDIGQHQT